MQEGHCSVFRKHEDKRGEKVNANSNSRHASSSRSRPTSQFLWKSRATPIPWFAPFRRTRRPPGNRQPARRGQMRSCKACLHPLDAPAQKVAQTGIPFFPKSQARPSIWPAHRLRPLSLESRLARRRRAAGTRIPVGQLQDMAPSGCSHECRLILKQHSGGNHRRSPGQRIGGSERPARLLSGVSHTTDKRCTFRRSS